VTKTDEANRPEQDSFLGLGPHGFHKVAYTSWGDTGIDRVAICVHGLTRNGRDFDALAQALAPNYRVACPDIAGRGGSDWLLHPEDYGYPLYMNDMAALIARLDVDAVDWIGTSMGGLIGMMLAAQPNSPIRRLVINDVGPFIPKGALERIGGYVGSRTHFRDIEEADSYLRTVHATFGPLSDAQWRHLATHSVRRDEGGGFTLHYDPRIGDAFAGPIEDIDLWNIWDAIDCPVLVLRGGESDLLLPETAQRMVTSGPDAELIEIPGVGHAPALMDPDQIGAIKDWLVASEG
jgi:pimeloyl-ACP methyl ester carboxylesterase